MARICSVFASKLSRAAHILGKHPHIKGETNLYPQPGNPVYTDTMTLRKALAAAGAATLLSACTNIDCPLDNVVRMQCNLYATETGQAYSLTDTLTVAPAGRDTVLLNRAVGVSSFLLPLKEGDTRDTLLLRLSDAAERSAVDTLYLSHSHYVHFESVDCPASVFHELEGVSFSPQSGRVFPLSIDSVALVRSMVNYEDIENVRIFLHSASSGN